MRRAALLALATLALAAQAPKSTPAFDEAFFSGDRRAVLDGCADRARSIKPKDAKYLAECGRAYLAAMDKPKAQAAVDLAEVGLVNEAGRYMGVLVALDKDSWERFLLFGRALLVAGQRRKAAVWFARAVALKPNEEKVFLEISRAFAETQSVM